jgi:hypothetical protein
VERRDCADVRGGVHRVRGGHVERRNRADVFGDMHRLPPWLFWRVKWPHNLGVQWALCRGVLWCFNGPHVRHVQWAMQRGLLLPRRVDVRDAVSLPGRPLLPVGHVLGDAVPLPRGHILARRRGLHGAGLMHSVPGRIVRQCDGADDVDVHSTLQHGLLLPLRVDVRDAVLLLGRPLLPIGNVLGGAVPLPRGYVLARRRGLHSARIVHSVPGRSVR